MPIRFDIAAESKLNRADTRAASMAVSPPPTTTTFSPTSTFSPELALCRNSVPVKTPGPSSPGIPMDFPRWAPIPTNTAWYSFLEIFED